MFVRDALQHVSWSQACRFFLLLKKLQRVYGFRYALLGGYESRRNEQTSVPGGYHFCPWKYPFYLKRGLVGKIPEQSLRMLPGLKDVYPKMLYLYDVTEWSAEGGESGASPAPSADHSVYGSYSSELHAEICRGLGEDVV